MNDQTYFLAKAAHELQTLLSLLCSSIQAIEAAAPEVMSISVIARALL